MSVSVSAAYHTQPPLFRQLRFEDNRRLLVLVGVHDENLTLLEEKLGVSIVHRGSHVTVRGADVTAVETAAHILSEFYHHHTDTAQDTPHEHAFADYVNMQQMLAPLSAVTEEDYIIRAADQGRRTTVAMPAPATPIGTSVEQDGLISVQTPRMRIKARNQNQHDYLCAIRDSTMVFGLGAAGTGKTFLAVAMAVSMLQRGEIERIVLTRPAREAGEQLGFLPGDITEKLDPYLRPIHDAFEEMMPRAHVEQYIRNRQIEIAPLAYMRGRTLKRAMVILDEAQNTTTQQMLMFLTRLGEGSKMIINGDPNQIDLPRGQESGLVKCAQCLPFDDEMRLIRYQDRDIVRHPLIKRIVASFAPTSSTASLGD